MRILTSVGVLVDDDTGLEGAVAVGGGLVPHVHSHAAGAAISRGSKVGVVGAGAVLGVEDDKVITSTALAVVVGLEVTGRLIESESVEQVVILVGGVVELGNGGIPVVLLLGQLSRVLVLELALGAVGAVVIEISAAASGVDLGNTIVAAGGGVVGGTITEPGEGRSLNGPGVLNNSALALSRVVDTPGVNLESSKVGDVVDDSVDLLGVGSVNISEQPV